MILDSAQKLKPQRINSKKAFSHFENSLTCYFRERKELIELVTPVPASSKNSKVLEDNLLLGSGDSELNSELNSLREFILDSQHLHVGIIDVNELLEKAWGYNVAYFPMWGKHDLVNDMGPVKLIASPLVVFCTFMEMLSRCRNFIRHGGDIKVIATSVGTRTGVIFNLSSPELPQLDQLKRLARLRTIQPKQTKDGTGERFLRACLEELDANVQLNLFFPPESNNAIEGDSYQPYCIRITLEIPNNLS